MPGYNITEASGANAALSKLLQNESNRRDFALRWLYFTPNMQKTALHALTQEFSFKGIAQDFWH